VCFSEQESLMAYPILSGSDYFHLLIDRKMKRAGMAGNISRVHFVVDSSTNLEATAKSIRDNQTFRAVSAIRYKQRWPFLPIWKKAKKPTNGVVVQSFSSKEEFESTALNSAVDNKKGLIRVDLCEVEDDSKHVVISMHHALFDHQGMMNFIHALNGDFAGPMFRESEPSSAWKMILNAVQMNVQLLHRSVWKLGSFLERQKLGTVSCEYRTVQFNLEETKLISRNAWMAGSKIGESTFHVSAIAQAVYQTLKARNANVPYLWFSVPHNQRRLGTKGHLLSNKLSFLFFRLNQAELASTKTAVASIVDQLKTQIKTRAAEKYVNLMKIMRFIPMPLYEQMVNLASGGRLSSFGFSDLGHDQLNMKTFCGAEIERVFRYPPIPLPPGFNVATVRTDNGLQLILAFGKELLTNAELDGIIAKIKDGLLTETIADD
jgi:NRPS condensation-like uncharacterized protein